MKKSFTINIIKIYVLILYLTLINIELKAQLNVDISYTPLDLVQNILVSQGVTVTNVQFTGNNSQKAYFSGNTNIGFTDGILLTTGGATVAIGPNNSGSAQVSVNTPGDADLEALVNYTTFDASALEFDFIPTECMISFYYVFGSEEYPEFVGTQYNDVFAFLLTGPNPNGGMYNKKNIALIPNTNLPVTINNVNNLSYSQYYVNNNNGQTIQFDGFTTPLQAIAYVVPYQTYHIKLVIADASDNAYDSGVFLKGGSFSAPSISATATPSSICLGASSTLNATGGNTYTWSNGMTGSSITVTPSITTTYTVTATSGPGCSGTATVSVTVNPLPSVSATASPAAICNGATSVLTASGANTYSWNTGGNTSSITVTPSSTTTYTVTGTNTAGCTGTATVSVTVNPLPSVTATASPATICNGASTVLTASGANTYSWNTGGNTASITVTPSSTTTYTVTGTTTAGCTSTASITINVIQSPVVDYSTTQSHCGQSDGNIMTNVTGGIPPYIYQWSNGANTSNLNNISAGNYTLTVSDSNGCSSYISIILSDAPMPQANFAPKPQITTIDDPIIYFENYSIGASSYQWDFGDGYSSTDYSPSHKYDLPGVYYVVLSVSDQYGCTDTVGGEIIIRDIFTIYLPNTFTPNENDLNDRYIIIGNNIDPSYFEMRIFNRWGKELFYTTDINQGWNGNFNGEPVPEGVYVVKVSFKILGFNEVKYIVKEIVVLR